MEAMSRTSAEVITEVVRNKPDALLCLAAGSTAIRTYEILTEMQKAGTVSFDKTRFVALDEWLDLTEESEKENCRSFLCSKIYGPLGIPEERIRFFDVHAKDLQKECSEMERYITGQGGIDCVLLGIGMNGHLGLNEPGVSFHTRAHVAELDQVTKHVGQKYFDQKTELTRGITLGIEDIFESRLAILQISGSHKKEIVQKLYQTEPENNLPATALKLHRNALIILDEDAASGVRNAVGGGEHTEK